MRALTRPLAIGSWDFRTRLTTTLVALAAVLGLGAAGLVVTGSDGGGDGRGVLAAGSNPVTPGSFTGYGFDQCLAPTQAKMDAWLEHSPFLSVGIYISGNSRACRDQPNLTPTWIATQLGKGWRLLPITLGPQSSCVGRFPRYGASIDPTISNSSTDDWAAARKQGRAEADSAVTAAQRLGIVPGSTLFYDLEGWSDYRNSTCRESALHFLGAWTTRVRSHGYLSGVYSSAGSGMRILEDARAARRSDITLPDQIWLARYDGVVSTSASQYFSDAGWIGNRVKQYQGGHDETWGGVTINIDRNYLHIGGGSRAAAETHCNGVQVDYADYPGLRRGVARPEVRALKCLLREQGIGGMRLNEKYSTGLINAIRTWQTRNGFTPTRHWQRTHWTAILSRGGSGTLKRGSSGASVWRVQRALNAKKIDAPLSGVFDEATHSAVRSYQAARGLRASGIVSTTTWSNLYAGK